MVSTMAGDDPYGGVPAAIFEMSNLEVLDLSYQAIRSVPPHIACLSNLRELNLSHCMLLESLPGEMGQLTKLRGKLLYFFSFYNIHVVL